MTLIISISAQVESKLRERAAAEGKDLATHASENLEQTIVRGSLDELLAPLRQDFSASGTTDDQLVAQITEARTAYRNEN